MATHVADESFFCAVVGQRDGAVAALTDMATGGALQRAGEAAAVEKEDDLLALRELGLHAAAQRVGENGGPSLVFLAFNAHVDNADDGQGLAVGTFCEGE